ncbi:retrovirus-related pol polyprotein from transposon TNT 1-94 [Tanacetum coccineum]
MDLFGPVKPQTISHNKYTLVIVDECSRYTWVFCLNKKNDAADCIISFIRKIENLNEVRVKELRSDNRIEFKNHKLEEFCDEKGISRNFSSPCTPEQNGVAERRNRTLIEAVRTMLNHAKLPKQFWGEAVNTSCYIQNRSIIVKRHRNTSYDLFRGRSPDISYFHVFGCLVHIHNHKDHLGKFDEKADDGFFLGYSRVAKVFRVFNIKRQEMKETLHVTFSEDDEAISQSSIEGDAINFNENRSFPDDEFLEPKSEVTQCPGNTEYFPYIPAYENTTPSESPTIRVSVTSKDPLEFTEADNHPTLNEPDQTESANHFEPHIKLVNIIGEPLAGITTRSRIRYLDAVSTSKCLYVNFLSEMEPNKLIEALEEEGWIIVMQEELNQFERNKEGIDYEETFTPVARLEAIRIFLAYAAYMGFMVYQIDVKSAFLNGKISEEVYVQQPPGFESSEFPNHVCKLDKALYGLKQAPRAWYETLSNFLIQHKFVREKHVKDLLKKYDLADCALVKCLMLPPNNLGPDESGVSVNETLFRGMIGSLMYLTTSRPVIQFSTCLCARYQANPKESYLVVVKRIFRYLKGTPNVGLWYPKGSGFDLKAYSDSDYTRCNQDRRSTLGGCQSFVAMSLAEAEYVASIRCCAQVLWIKSQLADYDVLYDKVPIFCDNTSAIAISNNPVLHSRAKHIDIRYHFIRDHILKSDIKLHFVPIDLQLADIFTKPLAEPSFTRLVAELGMLNIEKHVSDKKKALSDSLT